VTTILWLLVAWGTAFAISVVPAFMPPMWAVLAAFRVGTGVPLFPLTIGAAISGALGRLVLAELARWLAPRLPAAARRNAEALGAWFERRSRRRWMASAAYAAIYNAGPLPSNALFIAAGAGRIPAVPLAVGYALARTVTDTFWVWSGRAWRRVSPGC